MTREARKKIEQSPQQKRAIRNRFYATLFLVMAMVATPLISKFQAPRLLGSYDYDENSASLIIINFNIFLLLILGGLTLRNIIKIIYERRKRELGFRLKSKLAFAFITIGALPTIIFYGVSKGVFTTNLDVWMKDKFGTAVNRSNEIVGQYKSFIKEDLNHYSTVLADEHSDIIRFWDKNEPFLKKKLEEYRLNGIVLYDRNMTPFARWFSSEENRAVWLPIKLEAVQFKDFNKPQFIIDIYPKNEINRSLVPIKIDNNAIYLEVFRVDSFAGRELYGTIRDSLNLFLSVNSLEPLISTTFNTYLLFLTLFMVFMCIWFGVYLARQITVPIDVLVGGTQRIAKDELNFQLQVGTNDEIGQLTQAFNSMIGQLKEKKDELLQSEKRLLKANENLEARSHFIETILDNIQQGVLSIDNLGFVKSWNKPGVAMFGFKEEGITGQHFGKVLPSDVVSVVEGLQAEMFQNHLFQAQQDLMTELGGQSRHLEIKLFSLVDEQAKMIGMIIVASDLTELDRSTRAKAWQEVARRIAHEIKNPLTPIQLSAQRLRYKFSQSSDNEPDNQESKKHYELLEQCTGTIIKEVDNLKNFVNEFEQFARIPDINPKMQSLAAIIEETANLYRVGLPKNISLSILVEPPPPEQMLDHEQIRRVLVNLLNNAIAAVEEEVNGEISINLAYRSENQDTVMTITDNGVGITLSNPQSIFDPYVTTKKNGTGLGLAIVRRIISDHNGFIKYEKNEPKGSKFIIELPLKLI